MKVAEVVCPSCGKPFIVDTEFIHITESYCHCPWCANEFRPESFRTSGPPAPGRGSVSRM